VLLGHGDTAVAEESATFPTWLFSALGWEAVFASETFVTTNQTTGPCYNGEYSNSRQCPCFRLCELSSAAMNEISPFRTDSPKDDFGKFKLWWCISGKDFS